MYQIHVFHPGDSVPRFRIPVPEAHLVLTSIPTIFAEHPGCDRLSVMLGETWLFSVDCDNTRIAA